ncbi:MAG: 50S ribosomal protein L11 methyltransferase [Patescibacteria group bacterium]
MQPVLFGLLITLLSVQLIVIGVLASFAVTLFLGSPWVPTPPGRARRMLEFAEFRPGETLLDLGSGDGAILLCAVEDFGAGRATGYEINPVLVAMARWRAWLRKTQGRVVTERKNIFTTRLPDVQVVSTFLIPSTMKRLRHKFATELKPDTRIISRGFAIPGVTPAQKREGPEEWMYLYRAGDLVE